MLPQLVHIADWYSIHALLQHAADVVIYQVEVRTVGWPHVRTDELRCLTAQKLDCVTSTMCWRIVLLEDQHVSSNAADCCSSFASAIRLGNTAPDSTKLRLVQPSLAAARVHVSVHVPIRDMDKLRKSLVATWAEFQQSMVDDAVDQWRKRLQACIREEGGHSEHLL